MDSDILMSDAGVEPVAKARHFVVAVDFGTTFSSVAYVGYTNPNQRRRIELRQVETIDRYPDHPYGNFPCNDVPTEIWYAHKTERTGLSTRDDSGYQSSSADGEEDDDTPFGDLCVPQTPEPELLNNGEDPVLSSLWGYGVQDQVKEADYEADHARRLTRFKLLLDNSEHTASVRSGLYETCKTLKTMHLIKDNVDVIGDYLAHLFRHTKKRLIDSEGYTADSTVEFVLCVPAVWNGNANRQMQLAMARAISNSGFGQLQNESVDNLFIVTEPEAAAACVLASEKTRLKIGETFILLDAGGGTVDAITYTVDRDIPLRLKTEEVAPKGGLYGSSFVNERFEKLLRERLNSESYLEQNGETLQNIIDRLVVDFERREKKKLDAMFPNKIVDCTIKVPGLRESRERRFLNGRMTLRRKEIKDLFRPSLEGVAEIMRDQLTKARKKGCQVSKVILMGGFGQSEALASYLKGVLATEYSAEGQKVILDSSKLQSTAVACGAVLRALRKEDGPARVLQLSYGFLRSEPYGDHKEHSKQKAKLDKIDGVRYVDNTICWIINKGDVLDSEYVVELSVVYTFADDGSKWAACETLYVSDGRHESHYRREHAENQGAQVAGFVDIDLTPLKESGQIKRQPHPKSGMCPYWKITGTLRVFVSGRNLRYVVIPDGGNGNTSRVGGECIAAAFRPGTE
ncbi:hypothetical protein A1O3_09936 [Capronia epimyces CBS 606.96]|uniref:Hsp70-like protein n=1 Tax=Capronia epimyces CBS 606.96 TaxID=1182542 RepID=W9XB32_9EURO|nr:uncharacterized protein A1O3_09936 [Capronia epimyces CBS 606.96]EXJ77707.1 hypothetical protein A1O3_09936 [Capronia epimyces CBS 606.96]